MKESERTYRLLIENANDIIWNFDLSSMRFTFLSFAVERILDYSLEEASRLTLEDMHPPVTLQRTRAAFRKLIAGENPKDRMVMEQEIYRATGKVVWMEMNVKLLRDEQGLAYSTSGSTRD